MRITLDTTILTRAHQNADGLARAILLELLERGHVLVLSPQIIEELLRVLYYPRLLKVSKLQPDQITEYIEFLSLSGSMTEIDENLRVPIRDPKDTHVVLTAMAGKAEIICTLDKHFCEFPILTFCAGHGIRVIDDRELIQAIRATPS